MNTESPNVYQRISAVCLVVLTAIALTYGLYYLRSFLVPFTLALLIYIMLNPVQLYQNSRLSIPKPVALTVAFALTGVFFSIVGLLFTISINHFLDNLGVYEARVDALLVQAEQTVSFFDIKLDRDFLKKTVNMPGTFSIAQWASKGVLSLIGSFVLAAIFLLFFMLSGSDAKDTHSAIDEIKKEVSKYIWVKLIISLATAICVGVFFQIISLELALTFAMLVFLLNFIPSFGSIIATLIPMPVAYLQFGFGLNLLLMLLIPGIFQFAIGSVLDPKIMGDRLGFHPIVVLLSLLFWGAIWGAPGMFLAIPIMIVLKIVTKQIDFLKPLNHVFEGNIMKAVDEASST